MKFLVYSATNSDTIETSLGRPEYSYFFVLKRFLPVLQELGEVVVVRDPDAEVDELYDAALAAGEDCVFLSFSPPHKTSINLRCPTYPVFAWEFDTIPVEVWESDPRSDWRYVLERVGAAITHSNYSVEAIHRAMGQDFPVVSIPSPAWDRLAGERQRSAPGESAYGVCLDLPGLFIDSSAIDFDGFDPLILDGPTRIENYDYAISIIRERDGQLRQRNADCLYAESIIEERDAQLAERNEEFAHAEAVIRERDSQLATHNRELAYAESIIQERDAQLAERKALCAHAEAIVRERDAQLAKRNEECVYAESIVRERDAQLIKRNEEFAQAEAHIREQEAMLKAIQSTWLGRVTYSLALRKRRHLQSQNV
jgi:hypothetical protein